jgi:hypothetical protein
MSNFALPLKHYTATRRYVNSVMNKNAPIANFNVVLAAARYSDLLSSDYNSMDAWYALDAARQEAANAGIDKSSMDFLIQIGFKYREH